MSDTPEELDRHAMKMAKKKAARDKIMATKTDKKGLVVVHTGKGKGKSSAAFGMIFRCIAHDMQCAVVQFIKGGMSTGERDLILSKFTDICAFINIALRYDYIDVNEVVAFLRDEKPEMTHVVLTGRNAKDELIELADLVTEMELVKHPFRSGIKAQIGVEF